MKNRKALRDPRHRFLALMGCFFKVEDYKVFRQRLDELKRNYFPEHREGAPVIFHRQDIIDCNGAFYQFKEDPGLRAAFDEDLLSLIDKAKFKIILIVIDKLAMVVEYENPFHPYHTALNYMLQRYCGYLNHVNRCGDVTIESRGKRENKELQYAYDRQRSWGCMYHPPQFYRRVLTSRKLKFARKDDDIAGIQLADILAYPLCQDLVIRAGFAREPKHRVFGKRIVQRASSKFNRHLSQDRIWGYGEVLFPLTGDPIPHK